MSSLWWPLSTMKKYSQAYIYRYWNKKQQYFGSSANTWKHRQQQHLCPSNTCTSRHIINGDLPWQCEIIESFPCENKRQLWERERFYIENFECVNEIIPNRTQKEYYEANREKLTANMRKSYEEDREARRKKVKAFRDANNEKVCAGRRKSYHKNKEKNHANKLASGKKSREKRKDKEASYKKVYCAERVLCHMCNTECARGGLLRHNIRCFKKTCDALNCIELE